MAVFRQNCSAFGPWLFLVDKVKFRIEIQMLPHSVQLGNFSSAGNLASLQVGPRSGYKMYQEPTDT